MMDHPKRNLPHQFHDTATTAFPEQPGTYAVIMSIAQLQEINIGALGEHQINPGFYAYVGSAFGPGGLRGRLKHHLHNHHRAAEHWHIDYLRSVATVIEVWWTTDPHKREHDWADVFRTEMNMNIPIIGFGSSDCNCISHLYYAQKIPNTRRFSRIVHACHNDHTIIHSVKYS